MRTLTALYILVAVAADHGTWDHPQQAELPSHEWLVVDHAPGGPNAAPAEGGDGGGSKKKKKSSNDSLALGLGLGLGLGGLLLIGLAMLCLSKKKSSTATRGADVENEMVKTGAAMS